MLYYLLPTLHDYIGWLNVFRYQTFRAMCGFLLAFLLVLFFLPRFIRRLQSRGMKQPIRDDGPKSHEEKKGTPTMGGLVVVAAVVVSSLLLADLANLFVWLSLMVMVLLAGLGFLDDWRKIREQNSKGVSEREKLLWQTAISATVGLALVAYGFSSELAIPFFKDVEFHLGLLFVPFVIVVVVGTSNAVNLTDGLDGLAIGPVMTVAATYAAFAYLTGNIKTADYLGLTHVPGAGELCIVLAAIVGAGLGFLWFNTYPAQVFMGDVGALSLGGSLGFMAIVVKHELVLIVAGGIFVIEALSVILQRYSYKLRGKRIFRMAPIHHHFELKGWAEPKIIVRFWIISIVLALVSLTTLKLR